MSIKKVIVGSDQKVDYLVVEQGLLKPENNINKPNYIPQWDDFSDPLIISNYEGDLSSSYVEGLNDVFLGFDIYRKEEGKENIQYKVATVDKNTTSILDYLVNDEIGYQWIVSPKSKTQMGADLISEDFKTPEFDFWTVIFLDKAVKKGTTYIVTTQTADTRKGPSASYPIAYTLSLNNEVEIESKENGWAKLIDGNFILEAQIKEKKNQGIIDENQYIPNSIWKLKCNISPGSFVQHIEKTQFNNYTKYPKFAVNDTNYITGSFSCLLGEVEEGSNTYNEPLSKYQKWNELVASGRECIIKDTKGNIIRAQITSNEASKFSNLIKDPPTVISFSFVETGSIDKMQLYTEVEKNSNV